MIEVKDDFLPNMLFGYLQNYCKHSDFQIVDAGDKQFSVLPVPDEVLPFLQKEGHEIILTFIRRAWKDFDTDMRAHCDGIIMNKQTSLASVLYINDNEGVTPNGTRFYSHVIHGESFPENGPEEEFNRLILEDSNNLDKWTKVSEVSSKPNRLLTYESNLFHSKFPNAIEEGTRIVLVVFYESKQNNPPDWVKKYKTVLKSTKS